MPCAEEERCYCFSSHNSGAGIGMALKIRLLSLLLLFGLTGYGYGHEIHLTNGKIIVSDQVQKSDTHVTYEQFGGLITVPLSRVEKVVYTSRSALRSQVQAGAKREIVVDEGHDLVAQFEQKLQPASLIEKANLAVVSIYTKAGQGSGFFISSDGLIVTNKHVIRGSKKTKESVEASIRQAEKKIEEARRALKIEKENLDDYADNLKAYRASIKAKYRKNGSSIDTSQRDAAKRSLQAKERYLEAWRADYQKRYRLFKKKQNELNKGADSFREQNREMRRQSRYTIKLADGTEKSVILYRISDRFDLALLKLNGHHTPYLKPADLSNVTLGQPVYAIGAPLSLNNSVTSGVISNFRDEFIQTNAEIYPGNSGGPLITETGEVLGVNTMKLITEKFEGLGFAISIIEVKNEFEDFFDR